MNNNNQDNGYKLERIMLYVIIVGFLGFVAFHTVRLVNARSNSQNVRYYQISPLPSSTFTPSPAAPTDTPPPPTATDTATPTQLPPTATDTATPTQLPPTATDTATPTQLPPTATDTATPTQLPPTATDTATPTQIPPTATDTATPTQIPPTATDTATPTQLPPTATPTDTPTPIPPTNTPPPPTPTDTPVPDGNKVTGGGWIDSPPGAYVLAPEVSGKANFGFVVNHKNGAIAPSGNTTFHVNDGDFIFNSVSYLWLAVNHNDESAIYVGRGNANGQPANFMVWVGDGTPDTFRIKIWSESGNPLYDNGSNQALVGGSIVIHKEK